MVLIRIRGRAECPWPSLSPIPTRAFPHDTTCRIRFTLAQPTCKRHLRRNEYTFSGRTTEGEAKSCEILKGVPRGLEFRVLYHRNRLFTEKVNILHNITFYIDASKYP